MSQSILPHRRAGSGTPLVEAMTSVAGACGNILYYNATMKMRDEIATGTQLQVAMRDADDRLRVEEAPVL